MCADTPANGSRTQKWETIDLPRTHVLRHLTDAHCHPTDLSPTTEQLDGVLLGGLAAMATSDDQESVCRLGAARPWPLDEPEASSSSTNAPRVVAGFGYHPWFVHLYSLQDPPLPKREHYQDLLSPKPALMDQFDELVEQLPEPKPFAPALARIREQVSDAKASGRLVLIGEIGIDGSARVRVRPTHSTGNSGDWTPSNLTPFKCSIKHQVALARAQLDIAVELGVNVSFHCVAAPGTTLEVLKAARVAHGPSFGRINIDIHSCGGMSPAFLAQAAKVLPNAYFSPSMAVTARSPTAAEAVRAIPRDRILVESDAFAVGDMTRMVWAATVWIADCRGWQVEDGSDEWELEEEEEYYDARGRLQLAPEEEVWAVRTLERNWARFMGQMI